MEAGAVVFWLGGSIAAAVFASNRGRSSAGWFFISLLISPILGLIFIAFSKDLSLNSVQTAAVSEANFLSTSPNFHSEAAHQGKFPRFSDPSTALNAKIENALSISQPTDDDFAYALQECESPARKPGVWAKAFAETQGEDSKARALYISRRAEEIWQQRQAEEISDFRKQEAIRKAFDAEAEAKRPMGHCPNCDKYIAIDSPLCKYCKADFSNPLGWKPRARPTVT